MFVSVIKATLKIVFAMAVMPFRIFSITVLKAGNKTLYLSWGHTQIDPASTSHDLSTKGKSAASIAYTTQGGGGYGVRGGRLLTELAGDGGGVSLPGRENAVRTGGSSGFLNVGYLVKRGSVFRLYPLIGVGGSRRAGGLVAEEPDSAERMVSGCDPLVNLGLGLEVKLGSRIGFLVGIRLGFVVYPFRTGRTIQLRPYAHVIAGLGTFGRPKKRKKPA